MRTKHMQGMVVRAHIPMGDFPNFGRGTPLGKLHPCSKYTGWYRTTCVYEGKNWTFFVYGGFVDDQNALNTDYNPTELAVQCGDTVTILNEYAGWLWVTITPNPKNTTSLTTGWIPKDCVSVA